jgi:AcrR family transcriptional regulator
VRRTTAPARRDRARRGEGGQLRAELVAAAERLLAATGDEEAVSIRAIADAVGVTPAAIYLHFPDKDALILEVCTARFTELARAMEQASAGIADPLVALVALGQAYIRFGIENPEQYRILFMRRNATRKLDPDELRESVAFEQVVRAVERCVQEGVLEARGDVIEIALELWSVTHGVTSLIIGMPSFPWPKGFADGVLTTYVLGLRSTPVTSS